MPRNMNSIMMHREVQEDVLTLARQRVARTFDRFDHVAVSFSGGKDSTVCLELTLEESLRRGRELSVIFFDEEAISHETIEYMERTRKRAGVKLRWLCVPLKHRNACSPRSPYWYPWAEEDRERWCRDLPENVEREIPGFHRLTIPDANTCLFDPRLGQVGFILGLRAQESQRRRWGVLRRSHDNFITHVAGQVYYSKPIYDWKTEDVWTAPAQLGWDYNRAYDTMTLCGIARHDQRVCPPYGEEPLRNLWMYSICWPELWELMIRRVPGAVTAARYSRGPLYAYGGVTKPDGVTWDDMVKQALQRWDEPYRTTIGDRLAGFITFHNKRTSDPMPEDRHPVTGIGWKFLYMIALRGDLKGRKTRKMIHIDDVIEEPDDEGRY